MEGLNHPHLTIPLRSSKIKSFLRYFCIICPLIIMITSSSMLVFAYSGRLTISTFLLLFLFVISWWPTCKLAMRIDYFLDRKNPCITLTSEELIIPTASTALHLPIKELRANSGYYYKQSPSPRVGADAGVFLHIRTLHHDLVLHGNGSLEGAPTKGIKRYTSPPQDKKRLTISVWTKDLMPLIEALSAYNTKHTT